MTAVKTNDDRIRIDRVDPAAEVSHEQAAGHQVFGVGVVGQKIAFVPLPQLLDHAMPGKVNQRKLGAAACSGSHLERWWATASRDAV